jgi:hypothetical protein
MPVNYLSIGILPNSSNRHGCLCSWQFFIVQQCAFGAQPTDPNSVGQVTAGRAQEEGSEFGAHASNPLNTNSNDVGCGDDPGRCGPIPSPSPPTPGAR